MNILFNNMIIQKLLVENTERVLSSKTFTKPFRFVKARVKFSEKLEDVRSKDLSDKKKEKEKAKAKGKNVDRAASIFRKKKK